MTRLTDVYVCKGSRCCKAKARRGLVKLIAKGRIGKRLEKRRARQRSGRRR
ncbi:MAG: hypothetical protein JRI68_06020 [Deltaproteobacteria bacterium]|nr:hypothetical protein [Deltaproteobacteria bacterium]